MLIFLQMIDTPEDQQKFERVYHEYQKLLFYLTNRILNNKSDAEDAVHQAFLSIAENIDKIDDPYSKRTKSYVTIIAEHKAIDMYRRAHKVTKVPFDEEYLYNALSACHDNILSECILKLPSPYKEIILLKYYHGYCLKEIAQMLKISASKAYRLLTQAKEQLHIMCEEEGLL